jgi:hypothetical protein
MDGREHPLCDASAEDLARGAVEWLAEVMVADVKDPSLYHGLAGMVLALREAQWLRPAPPDRPRGRGTYGSAPAAGPGMRSPGPTTQSRSTPIEQPPKRPDLTKLEHPLQHASGAMSGVLSAYGSLADIRMVTVVRQVSTVDVWRILAVVATRLLW